MMKMPAPRMPTSSALAGGVKSSHTMVKPSQLAALHRKAIGSRLAPAHSALVRQKSLSGKGVKSLEGDLKKAKGGAKGLGGKELAQVKKAALPTHKLAAKNVTGLKKVAGSKKKVALKAMAPTHSALVRQKSLSGKGVKSLEGDLKKAKGGAKGLGGKELAQVKKLMQVKKAPPVHKLATKNVGELKKVTGSNKKAALKRMVPAHSALVRQKKLPGQHLAAGRSTIGKAMTGIKKAGPQSKVTQPAKALQAAKKARPPAFGRLLGRVRRPL
jgi:hypothetical protein